jgi:UDP-N-acetylglucosamine acyltransferase
MAKIHPTAIVEKGAQLAGDVIVGPYCLIGPKAVLHTGVELVSHVIVSNETIIGEHSKVFSFASLGAPGQIYQHKGEVGRLEIGKRCEIREYVTMNCGSPREQALTKVEDDCMFMVASHVAHDCYVGQNCIFANQATIGGHTRIGAYVFIGGLSAVHQFCEVGEHTIIGALSGVRGHVIPYGSISGDYAYMQGINIIGLERRGFSKTDIRALNAAYRKIFLGEGMFNERLKKVETDYAGNAHVQRMVQFIRNTNPKRQLAHAEVKS